MEEPERYMCRGVGEEKAVYVIELHLAGAPLNPSRSHIPSKVLVIILEDPKTLCSQMRINTRPKRGLSPERSRSLPRVLFF